MDLTYHSASLTAALTSGVIVLLALYSSMVDILSTLSEQLITYSLSSLISVNCGVLQLI